MISAETTSATGEMAQAETVVEPICQWFGLCGNPATSTERHFIAGEVPICETCADKLERMKAYQCPTA